MIKTLMYAIKEIAIEPEKDVRCRGDFSNTNLLNSHDPYPDQNLE